MFSGQYGYAVDDKGRLSIPAKLRDALISRGHGSILVLTNHMDGCIVGYPLKEWEALQERIEKSEIAKTREAKNVLRVFYAGASECPIDRLGRILLPQSLRSFGAIKKNVMIVGMNKKIEIWAEEAWGELVQQTTADRDRMTDIASQLGL